MSGMYIVDATANDGMGMVALSSVTRCTSDNKNVHTAIVGVQPGHTYYLLASDNNSVELYGLGFCLNTDDKYDLFTASSSDGISSITTGETKGNGAMYNLAGQRISAPVSGQIYIQDGKKFIKK